mmetsp:Transcript_116214/g.339950  ORF Transcript_116214/g.339950 Transcript_116214/m.339950 type:complete len:241 (+) Transcript_116214:1147-1869(+)
MTAPMSPRSPPLHPRPKAPALSRTHRQERRRPRQRGRRRVGGATAACSTLSRGHCSASTFQSGSARGPRPTPQTSRPSSTPSIGTEMHFGAWQQSFGMKTWDREAAPGPAALAGAVPPAAGAARLGLTSRSCWSTRTSVPAGEWGTSGCCLSLRISCLRNPPPLLLGTGGQSGWKGCCARWRRKGRRRGSTSAWRSRCLVRRKRTSLRNCRPDGRSRRNAGQMSIDYRLAGSCCRDSFII